MATSDKCKTEEQRQTLAAVPKNEVWKGSETLLKQPFEHDFESRTPCSSTPTEWPRSKTLLQPVQSAAVAPAGKVDEPSENIPTAPSPGSASDAGPTAFPKQLDPDLVKVSLDTVQQRNAIRAAKNHVPTCFYLNDCRQSSSLISQYQSLKSQQQKPSGEESLPRQTAPAQNLRQPKRSSPALARLSYSLQAVGHLFVVTFDVTVLKPSPAHVLFVLVCRTRARASKV